MRRITVEEIKEAYKTTGLEPCREAFRDWLTVTKVCSGCAITALAACDGVDIVGVSCGAIRRWANQKFGTDYVDGFLGGFDGSSKDYLDSDEMVNGFMDGSRAAAAIFAEVSP